MKHSKKFRLKKLFPLLLLLSGTIYLFFFPDSVNKDELTELTGILLNSPKFYDVGVPGHKSISFKFKNHTVEFDIESCSYDNLKVKSFMSLKEGDTVIVSVRKQRTIRERINRDHDCFDLRSPNGEIYLHLSETNNCHTNSWKIIGVLCLAIALFIGFEKF